MQIITTKGKVLPVKRAVPVVEKQVPINGEKYLLVAQAKDLSVSPTAIAFGMDKASNAFGCSANDEIVVGNIQPDKVVEILRTLNEKGSYDLSSFPEQKARRIEQINIDNGASGIYSSETFSGFVLGMNRLSDDTFSVHPFIVHNGICFNSISDCSATEGMEELAVLDEGSYDEEEGLDE